MLASGCIWEAIHFSFALCLTLVNIVKMKVSKNKVSVKRSILALVLLMLVCSCSNKANLMSQKLENLSHETIINNSILAEAMVMQSTNNLDTLPHNVLCIGNSMTIHQPLNDVNWYSRQGMAATKPEFDYCHILEKLMRKHNPKTTVTPIGLGDWERNFSINIDSLLKDICQGKDIIVIRIGENVKGPDIPRFADELSKLIDYCSHYTKKIILAGQYWPLQSKEMAVIKNARDHHLKYVPLYWIWNLYQAECCPKEGDIIYDTIGKPYRIKGNFIITHPNNKGMELIATAIYNYL